MNCRKKTTNEKPTILDLWQTESIVLMYTAPSGIVATRREGKEGGMEHSLEEIVHDEEQLQAASMPISLPT